jgi:hypothetical protein
MKATASVRKVQLEPAAVAPTKRVIDLTVGELGEAIGETLASKLEEFLSGEIKPPGENMTRTECADFLRISTAQLDILSRRDTDPVPFELCGESRRYVRTDVREWLRRQRKAATGE